MRARHFRPTVASVDLGAIERNVARLVAAVAPAEVLAVVKADGYGHGAAAAAKAALAGGARRLAAALVEEGVELRAAGIEAPVLLLSEPPAEAFEVVLEAALTPTLYSAAAVEAARAAVRRRRGAPLVVEVKVDTGMHRVGCAPEHLVELVRAIATSEELRFGALWSHFAVADLPEEAFSTLQLERLLAAADALASAGHEAPLLHIANSAAALHLPASRLDLVRCGLACYGIDPSRGDGGPLGLEAALALRSRVHLVRRLEAGERPSYGRLRPLAGGCDVATVPIGYADGVARAYLAGGGEVLIGGRRHPLAGAVTMDHLIVELREGAAVRAGDEVVLIGRQGDEEITVAEFAERSGRSPYEVLVTLGTRLRRCHRGLGG